MKKIPLYIHIPFCRSKCGYCAFYSSVNHSLSIEEEFLKKLYLQIAQYMEMTGSDYLKTVYIGGGTPSMLSRGHLQDLFSFLDQYIESDIPEFTMECNPEDVTEKLIHLLNNSPVNRISLGVQSFNQQVLSRSGRLTSPGVIDQAVSLIEEYWSGRFSIDIITGLPGQTVEGQKEDIKRALQSSVDHISCYSLILEENTPLYENRDIIPGEDDEDLMWTVANDSLIDHGFVHYEVSNYSRSGCESLHNMQYWQMNEYIGCGPGAVSMIFHKGVQRITNPRSVTDFSIGIVEKIEPFDFLFENYMMGLRTKAGIDRAVFLGRFGSYPEVLIENTVDSEAKGTFLITEESFALSEEARLFMNSLLMKIYDELSLNAIEFDVNWP